MTWRRIIYIDFVDFELNELFNLRIEKKRVWKFLWWYDCYCL